MIYGKYLVSLTLFRPTNHHYIVQTCSHWAVGSRVTPPLKQTPHPPKNIFVTTWAKSTFKTTFSYPDYFKTLSHMFFSHRGRTVSDRADCNRGHRFNSLTTPLFLFFFLPKCLWARKPSLCKQLDNHLKWNQITFNTNHNSFFFF